MPYRYGCTVGGHRYLKIQDEFCENDIAEVAAGDYERLIIVCFIYERVKEISFFDKIPSSVKWMSLETKFPERIRLIGFEALIQLDTLYLDVAPKNEIEIGKLENLTQFSIESDKNILVDFQPLKNLEDLALMNSKDANLDTVSKSKRISNLHLTRSQFTNLAGIELLKNLQTLELYDLRKLTSVSSLTGHRRLKTLRLEACNKIEDIEGLVDLPALEFLALNVKSISSLEFIANFKNLKSIAFGDTNVIDGDLNILNEMPNLKTVGFRNKRHYTHKYNDFDGL